MAQEVAIKLNFDAGNSVKSVNELEKEIKNLTNETNELRSVNADFKQELLDLEKAYKQLPKSSLSARKSMKDDIDQLKFAISDNNAVLQKFRVEKAQKKEVLRDLNDFKDGFSSMSDGILETSEIATSGYMAFQGVTAMLGTENEELMQTMVKLQGAQSALTGIMKIKSSLEKESNAMRTLEIIKTKALATVTWLYNSAIAGTTGALKIMRIALIATGLGAIVVLIGTLVANWDKWKDSIMSFINSALAPLMPLLKWLGVVESDNAKIRREAHEQRVSQINEQIELTRKEDKINQDKFDHEIALLKASGKETFEVEKKKLEYVKARTLSELKLLKDKAKLEKNLSAEQQKEMAERINELVDQRRKATKDLEILETTHNKKIEDKSKKHSETLAKEREKAQSEEDKAREDAKNLQIELQRQIEDYAIKNIADSSVRKIAQLKLNQAREREEIIKKYGEDTELLKQLDLQQATQLAQAKEEIKKAQKESDKAKEEEEKSLLNEELNKEKEDLLLRLKEDKEKELQIERDFLEQKKELGLISEREYTNGIYVLNQRQKEFEENKNKAIIESRKNVVNSVQSTLNDLAGLFGENEKAQKAFAIAQAGIDTAKAISSLIAMSQSNPANAVTGGVAGAIQYASGAIQIATSMKKVYSLLKSGSNVSVPSFSGGSGGGSNTSNGRTDQPTQTNNNDVGRTEFVQNDNRVVLVESEVNAMRMRANQIDVISSI